MTEEATDVRKYAGYNGTVVIQGAEIRIERKGMGAKLSGNGAGWTNSVHAVSGVESREPKKLTNGWVCVELGGEKAPTLGTTSAGSNPNTVIFTYQQRDAFQELVAHIGLLVKHGKEHGVNPADFDARPKPAQPVGAGMGPGGVAAASGLSTENDEVEAQVLKLKAKVLASLRENLAPDEQVAVVIRGSHGQAIIGTTSRAFVIKPGFMAGATGGVENTSWSYRTLVGIQMHKGMMSGSVVIQAPGQVGTNTSYWKNDKDDPSKAPNAIPVAAEWEHVQQGVAKLRQLIDAAHAPAPAAEPTPAESAAPSKVSELAQLAELKEAGHLSEEEFVEAKRQILGS